jgi:hypothetical protein
MPNSSSSNRISSVVVADSLRTNSKEPRKEADERKHTLVEEYPETLARYMELLYVSNDRNRCDYSN